MAPWPFTNGGCSRRFECNPSVAQVLLQTNSLWAIPLSTSAAQVCRQRRPGRMLIMVPLSMSTAPLGMCPKPSPCSGSSCQEERGIFGFFHRAADKVEKICSSSFHGSQYEHTKRTLSRSSLLAHRTVDLPLSWTKGFGTVSRAWAPNGFVVKTVTASWVIVMKFLFSFHRYREPPWKWVHHRCAQDGPMILR